jgi:hypothetical protein
MTTRTIALTLSLTILCTHVRADEQQDDSQLDDKQRLAVRDHGLQWLPANQSSNGSWGKQYSVAVTSFACLSYLAASEEPFKGERGKSLLKGLAFLTSKQTDGLFINQGHTWIHGQGFATLALSEAYGRSLTCKIQPDIDTKKIRAVVEQAVTVIAENQSTSGGWWYTRGNKAGHEGSTTCCAVQALVSADNYNIEIDKSVLRRGFEYLKKCQNKDGGFDYRLGPGEQSMKEGTGGGVATLGLMRKFDYAVMMNGYKFLINITPHAITKAQWPYYGHFYGAMGMRLLGQEMKHLRETTDTYTSGALKDLVALQQEDGSWPLQSWVRTSGGETPAYSTAFATLTLSIPDGRLSVFNRTRPELPKNEQPVTAGLKGSVTQE